MNESTPVALVTGANKGLGLAVARGLLVRGYRVHLACRDRRRGERATELLRADGDARFVVLDVTDDTSVDAAAAATMEVETRLDVLVNNAGIYVEDGDGPPTTVDLEALRRTWEVNVIGPLRVTRAFAPLLRAAGGARVVMLGSGLGSLAWQLDPGRGLARWPTFAYASSKTGLNALTVALANELRDDGIRVNAVNPGFVATDLNGMSGTLSPDEGAAVVLHAASPDPDGPTGAFLDTTGTIPW